MTGYFQLIGAVILTFCSYSQAQRLSRNPCARFRCLNGGTCSAPADAPRCLCPRGYAGDRCQTKTGPISRDPCRNFICENGGSCTAPADAPYCLCPPEFTGKNCQTALNTGDAGQCPRIRADRNAICVNGGVFCATDSACPTGQKCCLSSGCGKRKVCTNVNPTILDPCCNFGCQNGGTCTAPADAPSCKCLPGFFGEKCEFNRDPCFNFKCQNGGWCTAPADAPYCECPSGFTGRQCETRVTGGDSGQCPIISKDSIGMCGGIMCSSDSSCPEGLKCCASACGGKLCINVTADPVVPDDPINLCSLIDCMPDRICRATLPCDTCEPVATCVPLSAIGEGIDVECQRQNYLQVLLVQSVSLPDNYSQLKCRGPLVNRRCPLGADCIDDLRGGGTCCIGKPVAVVNKPGVCPISEPGDVSVCGGRLCDTDDQCPGSQKCCINRCGGRICTNPDTVSQGPTCPGGCPKGYTCEFKGVPCKPGMFCSQLVKPTCIPPTDECGGCPSGQKCELLFPPCAQPSPCASLDQRECIQTVCNPIPRCVPIETTPAPVDQCGGCPPGQRCQVIFPSCIRPPPCDSLDQSKCVHPVCSPIRRCVPIEFTPAEVDPCGRCKKGQVCIDTGIICITAPCPTFQCVANNSCGGCPPGQRCHVIYPDCIRPPPCNSLDQSDCVQPVCSPIRKCVPIETTPAPVDPCGGCKRGQVCIDTGIRCITTPCATFQCVANNSCGGCPPGQSCQKMFPPCLPPDFCDEILKTDPNAQCEVPECKPIDVCVTDPVTVDECGGCPPGQICQPTGVVCKKAPCPSFSCVPILIVDPPPLCNNTCPTNTVCELKPPTCPGDQICTKDPVPHCTSIQLASCPKFAPTLERCPIYTERDICSSDDDCNARLNQRCCPSKCNVRVCTTVPRRQVGV